MKLLISLVTLFILLCSCESDAKLTFNTEYITNEACKQCPIVEIELPVAEQSKKIGRTIGNSLNEEVIALLLFEEKKSIRTIPQAINSFESAYKDLVREFPDESIPWEARINGEVIYEDQHLISIQLNSYVFTGGAHGYGSTHFLNFNRKNGEELERNDLIKNRDKFEDFAEMKFREQESIPANGSINSTGFMFERDAFHLPENIGYTEEGLKLLYNPYEVASYADGVIELVLTYDEVQDYLAF